MKYIYIVIVNIVFSVSVFSQENKNTYEFIGALTTTDQGIISYKINLEVLDNGKLKGVSVTDFYGENSTKANIIGAINYKKQLISFKEVSNISTNSSVEEKFFCFITTNNLKLKSINGKTIAKGDFMGKYPSGDVCANGKIYLVSSNIIDDLQAIVDTSKINNDTLKKIKTILNLAKSPLNDTKIVKSNNNLKVDLTTDHIIFDVWDGNKEDNDMINIYFNGKLIEQNLIIKNKKKTIDIPFNGEKGYIRIYAVNEGDEVPNTVNFMLRNGANTNAFLSTLHTGEEFTIEFNRK
jgi:hypothetical protein